MRWRRLLAGRGEGSSGVVSGASEAASLAVVIQVVAVINPSDYQSSYPAERTDDTIQVVTIQILTMV
jgi:hypothetical protein